MNRKRTQLLLMLTVLVTTCSIIVLFATISFRNLRKNIVTQILEDNKAMGEYLFRLFQEELVDNHTPEDQILLLQKFANEVSLPNGGFVCALTPEGDVVAHPELKSGTQMSIGSFIIHDEEDQFVGTFNALEKGALFGGFLKEKGKPDQIIYSQPLGDSPLRLNVHQNMKEITITLRKWLYPSVGIGFVLAMLGVVLVFFLSDRIVSSYESELEVLNENLQEVNKERTQLLRVLSHDISNPLSVIEMATSLTDIGAIEDDALRENFQMVQSGVTQAIDIITLNREMLALEDRKKELHIQVVSVAEVVKQAHNIVKARLESKDVNLEITVEEGLQVLVEPVSFLHSVLNNIMTNAIKFSFPHSAIVLNACREDEMCHISIKDSGIGMPQELIEKLFHPYEKTSRRGTSDEVGTGFGMPIMSRFVELYGGCVDVESIEGTKDARVHGTTFHLRLPLEKNS